MDNNTKTKVTDPLLEQNANRFTVFPIKHHAIWGLYKQALANFWVVEEVSLTQDLVDWTERLNDQERFFIKNVLAFFAASDGIVNENLVMNFYDEFQVPEIRQYYATQIHGEAVHSEMYSLLIDTYVKDPVEKGELLNSIESNGIVKKKAEWALRWASSGNKITERLIAFSAVEGIFFSGSFCSIYWLKSRGLMPGLCVSNEFISRDEALHCSAAIQIYSEFQGYNRLGVETVHAIYKSAVDIEKEFIAESLPVSLIGMNKLLMIQYIEFVCDYYLLKLGYPKIYGTENPFSFMNYISIPSKTNFFEKKVSQYAKAGVGKTADENSFSLDADF